MSFAMLTKQMILLYCVRSVAAPRTSRRRNLVPTSGLGLKLKTSDRWESDAADLATLRPGLIG